MWQSGLAILRAYLMFKPYAIFASIGALFAVGGLIPFIRYLFLLGDGARGGHIQSLLLGITLLLAAVMSLVIGIVADLTRINRILQEDQLELQKRMAYGDGATARSLQSARATQHTSLAPGADPQAA
jgi:hypothetical protein